MKKTSQINIRVTPKQHKLLTLAADAAGLSMTEIIALAIDSNLDAIVKRAEKDRLAARQKLDKLLN